MAYALIRLHGVIEAAARALALAAGLVLLLGMGVLTTIDVVLRQFAFGVPATWEIVTLAMRWMIGLALPYAFAAGIHVTVEVFTEWLPRRTRRLLVLASAVIAGAVMALLCWRMAVRGLEIWASGGRTSDLGVSVFYHWLPLIVGAGVSVAVIASLALRDLVYLVRPDLEPAQVRS